MTRPHTTPEETQAYHGQRVEARQAERRDARFFDAHRRSTIADIVSHIAESEGSGGRPWDGSASHARVQNAGSNELEDLLAKLSGRPKAPTPSEEEVIDTLFSLALLSVLAGPERKEPEPQERIDPIDANLPPLFQFWNRLNTELEAAGKPHADYKTARTAFSGGATPEGSLTFIGKEWDGLRAIPGPSLDGGRIPYHGQFREVSEQGTVWRTVHSQHGPINYISAEGALNGAKSARDHAKRTGQ